MQNVNRVDGSARLLGIAENITSNKQKTIDGNPRASSYLVKQNWFSLNGGALDITRPRIVFFAAILALLPLGLCGVVSGQGPGGGGAPPGGEAPVFEDPKFRDRVWEEGGPQFVNIENGKQIIAVSFDGNKTLSENFILSHMETRPNRIFDSIQLSKDVNALYRTNLFAKIQVYHSQVDEGILLHLVINENPSVSALVFHGNKRVSDRELIKELGLKEGDPINPQRIQYASRRLKELYRNKGFNDVAIEVVDTGSRSNQVVFSIHEGELNRIAGVKIVGSKAFSEAILKTKISSKPGVYGVLPYAFNIADFDQIERDRLSLESYYRSLGYFDARVDASYEYDDTGKWIYLTFAVSEGERFQIDSVEIKGCQYFSEQQLISALELTSGKPFLQVTLDRDLAMLNELYGRKGFLYSEIAPVTIYLPNQKLKLIYEIEEGAVYRISEVNVQIVGDDSFTRHRVAENIMGDVLRPGRPLNSNSIEIAKSRLGRSDIFNSDPTQGEVPDIRVRVLDSKPSNSQ